MVGVAINRIQMDRLVQQARQSVTNVIKLDTLLSVVEGNDKSLVIIINTPLLQTSVFTNSGPSLSSIVAGSPASLSATVVTAKLNGQYLVNCLIDTGSSDSFICQKIARKTKV